MAYRKFSDVGCVVRRDDRDSWMDGNLYKHKDLFFSFVQLHEKGYSPDGSVICTIKWGGISSEKKDWQATWSDPKILLDEYSNLRIWEGWEKANLLLRSIRQRWGWYVYELDNDTLSALPEQQGHIASLYAAEAATGKYGSEPSWSSLNPYVLYYIGLPALKINRTVHDSRVNRQVPVVELMPEEMARWHVDRNKFYCPSDISMPTALATHEQDAKHQIHQEINDELDRLDGGSNASQPMAHFGRLPSHRLKYVYGSKAEDFRLATTNWFNALRPVITEAEAHSAWRIHNFNAPQVIPIKDLLDTSIDYTAKK
jgi:hypothetical protein